MDPKMTLEGNVRLYTSCRLVQHYSSIVKSKMLIGSTSKEGRV